MGLRQLLLLSWSIRYFRLLPPSPSPPSEFPRPLFLLLVPPPRSLPRTSPAQLSRPQTAYHCSDAVASTQKPLAASDNCLFRHAVVSRDEALVLYEDMVLGRVFEIFVRTNVLPGQDVRIRPPLQWTGGRLHRLHQAP